MATAPRRGDAEQRGRLLVRVGRRLAVRDLVAADGHVEELVDQRSERELGQRPLGVGDQRRRDPGRPHGVDRARARRAATTSPRANSAAGLGDAACSRWRPGRRPAGRRRGARCRPTPGRSCRASPGRAGRTATRRASAPARAVPRPRPARSRSACRPCRTAPAARHPAHVGEVLRLGVVDDDRRRWTAPGAAGTPRTARRRSGRVAAARRTCCWSSRSGQAG